MTRLFITNNILLFNPKNTLEFHRFINQFRVGCVFIFPSEKKNVTKKSIIYCVLYTITVLFLFMFFHMYIYDDTIKTRSFYENATVNHHKYTAKRFFFRHTFLRMRGKMDWTTLNGNVNSIVCIGRTWLY